MRNNVEDVLKRIRDWSAEDLKRLRDELDVLIRRANAEPLYDLREFRGIGHGTWREVGGVDEFIKQERASWGKSWDEYEKHLEERRNS